ncbi:uncharacterized protein [Haliotis cracherodii]|uniref:uncharacterized protein n=1 Tax=Haliotis cracherodii TaxID=6455 RepID=UPI0039ED7A47
MPPSEVSGAIKIKTEPTYVATNTTNVEEEETAYFTRSRRGRRGYGFFGRGNNNHSSRSQARNNHGRRFRSEPYDNQRVQNPIGHDGRPLRCKVCESVYHFIKDCPDSYENMEKRKFQDKQEEFVLFTGNKGEELQVLVNESLNSAVLDSACSSTVAGEAWMNCYIDTLEDDKVRQVNRTKSDSIFKFGGGRLLKSIAKVTFPCEIAGVNCTITTDVVQSDIPLLLGKPAMKAAKVVLDLENDRASIFGKEINLQCTSSGHYCIPILHSTMHVNQTFEVLYSQSMQSRQEKKKKILKLHRQFAHPSSRRLLMLLEDAGIKDDTNQALVDEVAQECDVCLKFKKTPARPVVSLPLATKFNEVVAMDLKFWKTGVYFLHLIDMATRFSLAAVIRKKTPEVVIDQILKLWVGSGLGTPRKFLADNGGEFANEEYRDMAENLNVEVMNTASFSPWQNGLCERNHAVVDDCVSKLMTDNPRLDLETALVWAINAKNSLQMVHGWSPYQLVFGANPNLPSTLVDRPPALEGTTVSEMFAKHLNSLHAARKAFIEAESSERIRRALRHNIRPSESVYQTGDKVYFMKEKQWKGPGKVLGQDGKTVFIRHGSTYVRVPTCRLLKIGQEFEQSDSQDSVDKETSSSADALPLQTEKTKSSRTSSAMVESDMLSEDEQSPSRRNSPPEVVENHTGDGLTNLPKPKDKVKYLLKEDHMWREAEVISRGGKATGKYRGRFNVCERGESDMKSVNFEKDVSQWQKVQEFETETDSNIEEVNIASSRHDDQYVKRHWSLKTGNNSKCIKKYLIKGSQQYQLDGW